MKSKTRKITAIVAALCVAASVSATAVVSAASNEEAIEPRATRVGYNFTVNYGKESDNGRATKTENTSFAAVVPKTNDAITQSDGAGYVIFKAYDGSTPRIILGQRNSQDTRNFSIAYSSTPKLGNTVGLKASLGGETGRDIHATGVWTP